MANVEGKDETRIQNKDASPQNNITRRIIRKDNISSDTRKDELIKGPIMMHLDIRWQKIMNRNKN